MASSVEMSPKKQKVSESEDRISNLPECILSHILSFLPTKYAVRTSVLSTRWIYLWTSITHLHFDDTLLYSDKKPQRKCFSDFVSRVLLHLTNSTIESCFLDVAYSYDPTLVNIWFSAILNRRVRKFIIHGSSHKDFSSQPLFSCKSLVELVLNISCYLRVPADVNLPNLETLDLSGIRFTSNLNELVLSFPLLKKFECQNCTWSNVQNVSLQVPALEVVVLKFGGSVYVANTCTIKFCNSRLTDFSYDGSTSQDYVLLNPPSDIHVFINILVPQYRLEEEEEKEISLRACMLLKQFSQVEYLKLGQTKVFAKALGSLEDFPAFMMLRHLELGYVTGEMLLELLLKSPNLTTLDIKGISEFETELLGSAFVPHCLSSTLEVVKLGMHKGHDFEFCVAKFVMEHALVLKRLSFSWYSHQLKCKTKRVKDKLFSFKKASNTAIIEFS